MDASLLWIHSLSWYLSSWIKKNDKCSEKIARTYYWWSCANLYCSWFKKRFLPSGETVSKRLVVVGLLIWEDYHPKFVGLTGTEEQIEQACKKYR